MKKSLFLLFWSIACCLNALPGNIIDNTRFSKPAVALESLDIDTFHVLRKFNPIEHVPEENWKEHPEYFLHRNRTVYLTADRKFAVKVWEARYASAESFINALKANFYDHIADIRAVILDQEGNCRGYITPYMVSRNFHREAWDSYGFALEKNAYDVKIFASYEQQPKNYQMFFDQLVANTLATGIITTDFCPNNVVIDSHTDRIFLIDLEDVLELKTISLDDKDTQMVLEYNPKDYLRSLGL